MTRRRSSFAVRARRLTVNVAVEVPLAVRLLDGDVPPVRAERLVPVRKEFPWRLSATEKRVTSIEWPVKWTFHLKLSMYQELRKSHRHA